METSFGEAYDTVLSELRESLAKVDAGEVSVLIERIVSRQNIFVVGAGRVGLMLRSFAMRLGHLGLGAHIVGSLTCPPICSEDLLLVASSSGETATVREVVRKAHECGAEIIAITAKPESIIAGLASHIVYVEAPATLEGEGGQTVSRQPMKTLFEQSLFVLLEVSVLMLMERTGQEAGDMARRHTNLE
jgi:6-phospho-3-hexuloisomerase